LRIDFLAVCFHFGLCRVELKMTSCCKGRTMEDCASKTTSFPEGPNGAFWNWHGTTPFHLGETMLRRRSCWDLWGRIQPICDDHKCDDSVSSSFFFFNFFNF
jgi:hypothetical protein